MNDGFNTYTVIGTHDANEFAVATAVIRGDVAVTLVDNTSLGWVEVVRADSAYDAASAAVNAVEAIEA
jgi:hypothetical protein